MQDGAPRRSRYTDAARRAHQAAEHEVIATHQRCKCPQNLLLLSFLGEVKGELNANPERFNEHLGKSISKAYSGVRDFPGRVFDEQKLRSIPHVGPAVAAIVMDNLWSLYPPEPATQEELQLEDAQNAAAAAYKVQERKRKAELKKRAAFSASGQPPIAAALAQSMPSSITAAGVSHADSGGAAAGSTGLPGAAGDLEDEEGEEAGRGKKKRKASAAKGKKRYIPGPRTANYAFLIVMYQEHMKGADHMTKADLLEKAEHSRLCNKSLYGQGNGGGTGMNPQAMFYTGWSSFSQMKNRDPPLVQAYSNPMKCRLTVPEGWALAKELHDDAVVRGWTPPLDPSLTLPYAIAAALGQSQTCPAPAPAGPTSALPSISQPVPSAQHQRPSLHAAPLPHASHSKTGSQQQQQQQRQHATASGPHPAPGSSQQQQQQNAVSNASAGPAQPHRQESEPPHAQLRLLRGMGFSDSQARKSWRASGGDLEAAVDMAVTISLLSDDEDEEEDHCSAHNANAATQPGSYPSDSCPMDQDALTSQQASQQLHDAFRPAHQPSAAPDLLSDSQQASQTGPSDLPAQRASCRPPLNPRVVPPQTLNSFPQHAPPQGNAAGASRLAPINCQQQPPLQHTGSDPMQLQRQGSGAGSMWRAGSVGGSASELSAQGSQDLRGEADGNTPAGLVPWQLPRMGGGYPVEDVDIPLPPLSPGACFADEYDVVLIIDNREQYARRVPGQHTSNRVESLEGHVGRLRALNPGLLVETRALEIGDTIWLARSKAGGRLEYVLDWVLERKRVDDLEASIKDRRYERQKHFLRRCGCSHALYLIEGDPDTLPTSIGAKAVWTAGVTTEVHAGFQVLHTRGTDETFRLYARLTRALQKKYAPLRAGHAPHAPQAATFAAFKATMVAAKKLTVRDVWGLMLTAVRGLGPDGAEAIVQVYPTPLSLWRAYNCAMRDAVARGMNVSQAAARVLAGVKVPRSRRCITENLGAAIFNRLFESAWHVC